MKKYCLTALCLCGLIGLSAQTSLVKDAQKSFKPGQSYQKWVETIKPAFTNPESSAEAITFFVPAKAGFENFDYDFTLIRAGQQEKVDIPDMCNSLIQAYSYALQALPLDSMPDAKGKVKPKYSKDLVNMVAGHYSDFDTAGRFLYNEKKWKDAAEAWDIYFAIPADPRFAAKVKADPDSLQAQNAYLQAFVVSQTEDYPRAIKLFDRAMDLGNTDKGMFQQAMYVAKMAEDYDKMYAIAERAYNTVGSAEPLYFQLTIEGKLRAKDYAAAKQLLDQALTAEPQNATYNIAMGSLLEEQGDKDKALEYYRKAAQYDPNDAMAFFHVGRILAEQSDAIGESLGANISENEYKRIEAEKINPLRREAAAAFEKAYALDNDVPGALQYLKNIYYVLGDTANFERVNSLF